MRKSDRAREWKNNKKLWRPRQSELPKIEEGTPTFVESKDLLRRWPSHWETPKDGKNLGDEELSLFLCTINLKPLFFSSMNFVFR